MISNVLAKDIMDSLDSYIDGMRIKLSDNSTLDSDVTWQDSVDDTGNSKITRDVKGSFSVTDKDGLIVTQVILLGGSQELYKEDTDYQISGLDVLDVTMTLEYGYDYTL